MTDLARRTAGTRGMLRAGAIVLALAAAAVWMRGALLDALWAGVRCGSDCLSR